MLAQPRHQRHQLGVGLHQELAPGALDRHRLDLAAVGGEPALLDEPAVGEDLHAPGGRPSCRAAPAGRGRSASTPIAAQVMATRSASPASWNSGGPGTQLLEVDLAVAEDVHLAVGHPAVDPARHLEDLVGAEVEPVQHVPAALDHVAVARVVDDHGVEARAR